MIDTNEPEQTYVDKGLDDLQYAKSRIASELQTSTQMMSQAELNLMKEKLEVIRQLESNFQAQKMQQQVGQPVEQQQEEHSHTM